MQGVALTSLWVAAVRAAESERPDGLFVDPFASSLAGDEGRAVLAKSPARVPTIETRTRFIDDVVARAMASGIRQAVILAAGMDSRAYRLSWPEGTVLFEVDQPEVLDHKQSKLAEHSAKCERRLLRLDLRQDWPAALVALGFDAAAPTMWLVEGLLPYLEEQHVRPLLGRIDDLSARGSRMTFDTLGRSSFGSPHVQPMMDFVASLGAPWLFGDDAPEGLLEPLGWDVRASLIAAVADSFGRWPFPVIPRGTPGVPQSFFVEAEKR